MIFHVIVACHNRRDLTVRSLQRAASAAARAGVDIDFTVYDDGSTDGTGDAIRSLGLPVTVLKGDGSAFWAKSMEQAERAVLDRAASDDWIVWLNDDVALDLDAFERAARSAEKNPTSVLVGSVRDPDTGGLTYGGYRRVSRIHPLRLKIAEPGEQEVPIHTFNGNLVLVPVAIAHQLGGIDGSFPHSGADTDYGLRCQMQGVKVLLLPGTFGTCARNPLFQGTVLQEWRRLIAAKGAANPVASARMLQKHAAPIVWPALWLSTYVLWWARKGIRLLSQAGKQR